MTAETELTAASAMQLVLLGVPHPGCRILGYDWVTCDIY